MLWNTTGTPNNKQKLNIVVHLQIWDWRQWPIGVCEQCSHSEHGCDAQQNSGRGWLPRYPEGHPRDHHHQNGGQVHGGKVEADVAVEVDSEKQPHVHPWNITFYYTAYNHRWCDQQSWNTTMNRQHTPSIGVCFWLAARVTVDWQCRVARLQLRVRWGTTEICRWDTLRSTETRTYQARTGIYIRNWRKRNRTKFDMFRFSVQSDSRFSADNSDYEVNENVIHLETGQCTHNWNCKLHAW